MKKFTVKSNAELLEISNIISETMKKGAVEINFRLLKPSKSLEQLGYYHGVVLPLIVERMEQDGNKFTISQVDLFLKDKFLREDFFNEITQEFQSMIKSKAELKLNEMSEFISSVILFSAEMWGLEIPSAESHRLMANKP